MSEEESLIQFPCDFPVKIIGNNSKVFTDEIIAIIRRHFPDFDVETLIEQPSKNGNYLGYTVTIRVASKAELDAFYQEVSAHIEVKMVL